MNFFKACSSFQWNTSYDQNSLRIAHILKVREQLFYPHETPTWPDFQIAAVRHVIHENSEHAKQFRSEIGLTY